MSSSRPSAPPAGPRPAAAPPCPCSRGSGSSSRGDQLRLTGTDLELTISVEVTVSGSGDGVVILPGRLASDIVRALPAGSVEVEVADDEARISAGRSEFSLRVLPADEFPRLTEATGEPVTLASAELATALSQVVRAASSDDARPILTGVLLAAEAGGLRLVATDSYRLAVRDLPGTTVLAEGQHVLVPSRALQELARVLDRRRHAHGAPRRAGGQLRGRRHPAHHAC